MGPQFVQNFTSSSNFAVSFTYREFEHSIIVDQDVHDLTEPNVSEQKASPVLGPILFLAYDQNH